MTRLGPEESMRAVEAQLGVSSSDPASDGPSLSAGAMVGGDPTADDWARFYMATHRPRFLTLARTVARLAPEGPRRILDVGPATQTEMMRLMYPEATVDTLGWPSDLTTQRAHERHIDYDLDRAVVRETWPELGEPYDLILLEEVIEHTNVRPVTLLELLGSYLRPGGHLVVETPNAAYLIKRVRSLLGRHPYGAAHDMTGASVPLKDFHGHFREYLLEELVAVGHAAGLEVESAEYRNDYAYQHRAGKAVAAIVRFLPERFHMQLLVVFRAPLTSAE